MEKFVINGGRKLEGDVTVSGSKNAALPIICASLLTSEKVVLNNVPNIADIHSMIKIMESIGVKTEFEDNKLEIDASSLKCAKELPDNLVDKMRASILMVGALMARCGEVKMNFPGGCVLGKRSVHAHTHALKELGADILDDKSGLHIKADKLTGKTIVLPELSVTATENAIMGAVTAEGETEIRLAAAEPHVQDLCNFLISMGADISGIGTNFIKINGVSELKGTTYSITGDYLEAGTFAIAAVATKGDVRIKGIDPRHLDSFFEKLSEMGAKFEISTDEIHILPTENLSSIPTLKTAIYPAFATDLQAPFTVLLTQAKGVSKVFETLFEGRLNYLFELEKMGAHVELLNPHQAIVIGPTQLTAVPISSFDIRAGAAMVIAALIAEGETEISNINYIDRGYEKLAEKLTALGADIKRTDT